MLVFVTQEGSLMLDARHMHNLHPAAKCLLRVQLCCCFVPKQEAIPVIAAQQMNQARQSFQQPRKRRYKECKKPLTTSMRYWRSSDMQRQNMKNNDEIS